MAILQTEAEGRTEEEVAAAAFRDELLQSTTARGRTSVQRVWAVCQELIESGKPITVAEVGRITEKRWGGPKAQGIRDQPDRLKRLVDHCAAMQKKAEGYRPSRATRKGDKVDALVAEVADQTVRARIRAIAEERDQLRHDLQILRKAYQRLAPVRDLTAEQCYGELPAPNPAHAGSSAVPPSSPTQTFTNAERESVRKFLDENFLYDEGFRIDEIHGLVTGEGRIVLPIAFITALRKVLGS